MRNTRLTVTTTLALLLAASSFLAVAAGPTYALAEGVIVPEPEPEPTPTKGNNGWGQEKRGLADGTNAGSFQGGGGSPTQQATKAASTER